MLAIFWDQGLKKYIDKAAMPPKLLILEEVTKEESEVINKWKEGDAKACTRIELMVGDSKMIHLSRATTAKEMWSQLFTVKELRGHLGVLATRQTLY